MVCFSSNACWCIELPKLQNVDSNSKCMCKSCLTKALSTQFNVKNLNITDDQKKSIAKLGEPQIPIEGVDFHINGKGLYTFTSWYLLRRGYCCENGCQNCPY